MRESTKTYSLEPALIMKVDSETAKNIIKEVASKQWPSEKIKVVEILGKIHIINVKLGIFNFIGSVPIDSNGMVVINGNSKWMPR